MHSRQRAADPAQCSGHCGVPLGRARAAPFPAGNLKEGGVPAAPGQKYRQFGPTGGRNLFADRECSVPERGHVVLHDIAYAVIGLVVGYLFGQGRRQGMPIIVILGLIGSFGAGFIEGSSKYGSILAAVVGAIILGWAGRLVIKK